MSAAPCPPPTYTEPPLAARVTHLERENAVLRRENVTLKAQERCTRAWLHNTSIPPIARLLALEALWQAGAAPGNPAVERPQEYTRTSRKTVAQRIGISDKTAARYWPIIDELELVKHHTDRAASDEGVWTSTSWAAPPSGEGWTRTWANPAQIRYEGATPAHAREATRQAQQRERVKRILAQCPDCGSTDVSMVCRTCGAKTAAADIPAAPALVRAPNSARGQDNLSPFIDNKEESLEGEPPPTGQLVHSVDGAVSPLQAASAVLAPAVTRFPDAIRMPPRRTPRHPKYLSQHRALTEQDIAAHLQGHATYGTGLCWPDASSPSGRLAQMVGWDSDSDRAPLIAGAIRLRRHGFNPLLVANRSKPLSGHMVVIFDEPIDPVAALATLETIAPELKGVAERFPDTTSTGGRLRLPGGTYLPVNGAPVPVGVALAPNGGAPAWVDGTSPDGWALIASAVSPAALLAATWVPPQARPKRAAPQRVAQRRQTTPPTSGNDFFATFNAANPIESLLDIGRDRKAIAPWRPEATASVHVYDDGHWYDYGPDRRHGRDAFDLWCAINGYWDAATNRPNRKAGYHALTANTGGTP